MCDGICIHADVHDTHGRSVRRRLSMHITHPRTALRSGVEWPVSGLGEGSGDSVCQKRRMGAVHLSGHRCQQSYTFKAASEVGHGWFLSKTMPLNTRYIIILDTGSVVKLATPAADVMVILALTRVRTRAADVLIVECASTRR